MDKHIEKFVHINRIKPCFQRDNIPDDDEDIEDIPMVEVTYPQTFPQTAKPISTPEIEITKRVTHTPLVI